MDEATTATIKENAEALQRYFQSFPGRDNLLLKKATENRPSFIDISRSPVIEFSAYSNYNIDIGSVYDHYKFETVENQGLADAVFRDCAVMAEEIGALSSLVRFEYRAEIGTEYDAYVGGNVELPKFLEFSLDLSQEGLAKQLDALVAAREAARTPTNTLEFPPLSANNLNIADAVIGKIEEDQKEQELSKQEMLGRVKGLVIQNISLAVAGMQPEEKRDYLITIAAEMGITLPKSAIPLRAKPAAAEAVSA